MTDGSDVTGSRSPFANTVLDHTAFGNDFVVPTVVGTLAWNGGQFLRTLDVVVVLLPLETISLDRTI